MDESLSYESLLAAAKKIAHRAMDDHAHGEYDEFALHAAVAIERLAKAVLVTLNPTYIVEMRNGSADMLFHMGGHLAVEPDKVRTVSAREAIGRLDRLGVLPRDRRLEFLIDLRNGTAHSTGDGAAARDLLPTLARTTDTLLTHLLVDPHEFWERWTYTICVAASAQGDEILRDVEIRIRQAAHSFDDRFRDLPSGAKRLILDSPPPENGEHWVGDLTLISGGSVMVASREVRCPACTGRAMVLLVGDESAGEGIFRPSGFICHLCKLHLSGFEELAACRQAVNVEVDWPASATAASLEETSEAGRRVGD